MRVGWMHPTAVVAGKRPIDLIIEGFVQLRVPSCHVGRTAAQAHLQQTAPLGMKEDLLKGIS